MRYFTKTHNSLGWLFPIFEKRFNKTEEEQCEMRFDEIEERALTILETYYNGQDTFTKDDMIDAFMKGASVMNQKLIDEYYRIKDREEYHRNFDRRLQEQEVKDQREIDIEKACEFLNKFLTDNKMKTILISELRKAMEEE